MKRPIRILHVVDSLGQGGLENGLVNLIQRLDPNRFENVVYAIRGLGFNADRLPRDRVRVICLGKKEAESRIQISALARGIRDVKPDIVHSRNWAAIEAVIAGRWVRSCAVLHSEHGLERNTFAHEPLRRIWFRRLAFELADQVLSVSHQLKDLHAQRTGFPARKIAVIHNGVDGRRFYPETATRIRVRAELGVSEGEFCIGAVGSLSPVKDHMTLLEAAANIDETCKDWRLFIIGEGPERQKLEAFVDDRRLKTHVSFLGSSDRVPDLLMALDVYVLSSVTEGISNSLLEAMATGVPVLVSATGGNPEVVIDGSSGLLFPVGNFRQLAKQLLLLRAQRELRVGLGQNALRRVREDFSIDSMVQKYDQLYESFRPATKASMQTLARV